MSLQDKFTTVAESTAKRGVDTEVFQLLGPMSAVPLVDPTVTVWFEFYGAGVDADLVHQVGFETKLSVTLGKLYQRLHDDRNDGVMCEEYLARVNHFSCDFESSHWLLDGRRLPSGLLPRVSLRELGAGIESRLIYDPHMKDSGYCDRLLTIVHEGRFVVIHAAPYATFSCRPSRWEEYFGPREGTAVLLLDTTIVCSRNEMLDKMGVVNGSVLRVAYV